MYLLLGRAEPSGLPAFTSLTALQRTHHWHRQVPGHSLLASVKVELILEIQGVMLAPAP